MTREEASEAQALPQTAPLLCRLHVTNYRCLADIDIPLSPLTAIVGANGAGKTTILRSIDLVLGEVWPTLRSIRVPQDFNEFDASRELEVSVHFDPPYRFTDALSASHDIEAIRLSCRPYRRSGRWGEVGDLHVELEPLDRKGQVPSVATSGPQRGSRPQFRPLVVSNDLRDHARVLFVDHRRSLTQHLPSMRGSILGRLLQPARKEFTAQDDFRRAYEAAMELLRTKHVRDIEMTVAETAKRMLGFLGRGVAESVEISFGFADPANPFNSLRLQYSESGLVVPGEELGLGIQSAMVVGVFEAFRQLGGTYGTVIIEEPEMYLHPQAQRYFYRLLCEMADKKQCQVIYSTHSPIFADVNRFDALRVVRRQPGESTRVGYVSEEARVALANARDTFKLGDRFDPSRNELLFARRALLVEGYGDRLAALVVAEKLDLDVDAEGISIVDCGGKAGIELLVLVCRALDIPFVVLHDEDIWPTEGISDPDRLRRTEIENSAALAANERISQAVAGTAEVFLVRPTLEHILEIGRDARDKPKRVVEAMDREDIDNARPGLAPLIDAVRVLRGEATLARRPGRRT